MAFAAGTEECPSTHWLTTKSKVRTMEYRWEIGDFKTKVSEGWTRIACPRNIGYNPQCNLSMLPDSDGFLCIEIKPVLAKHQVAFYACILDVNDKRVCCKGSTENPEIFMAAGNGIRERLVKRSKVLQNPAQYLRDDKLSVLCIIHYLEPDDGTHAADRIAEPFPIIPPADGSSFMGNVLTDGLFSDVTVEVGNQKFPAQRAVLAERSEVFRAMFNADMEESREKRVAIDDMSADAVSDLLTFIYTDRATNIGESGRAEELLAAAEKYNIPRLKEVCEMEMARCLSTDNITHMLVISETYRATQLRKMTLHWMARHARDVVKTESWESFCDQHPELLKEVCENFAGYISTLICEKPARHGHDRPVVIPADLEPANVVVDNHLQNRLFTTPRAFFPAP